MAHQVSVSRTASSNGYPDIGGSFGRIGRVVARVSHKATLLGVTTIFLILAGKFLTEGIGGQGDGFSRTWDLVKVLLRGPNDGRSYLLVSWRYP